VDRGVRGGEICPSGMGGGGGMIAWDMEEMWVAVVVVCSREG
jgi:hypothetical protein